MLVERHVTRLVRVVVHMNPRRSQLDAPKSSLNQVLQHDETGMGIHAADIHGIAASMGGRGHAADRLVVLRAAVRGRKGERDARQIAGLVEQMQQILLQKVKSANIPRMIVTLGEVGAVYATADGESGFCPAQPVHVRDTTGAGDAFFAGITIGLTYGKGMQDACAIGTRLAAATICTLENVCPRFMPGEFGLEVPVTD